MSYDIREPICELCGELYAICYNDFLYACGECCVNHGRTCKRLKIQLYVNSGHSDACKYGDCVEISDYAYEVPLFNVDIGAKSPYRNHTHIYCRIHGELFEIQENINEQFQMRLEARQTECDQWV